MKYISSNNYYYLSHTFLFATFPVFITTVLHCTLQTYMSTIIVSLDGHLDNTSSMPDVSDVPYFFYIFDHLKIIIFFADRIIGITPKLTENLEPNTNCIPDAPIHVCILIVKVRRCRLHIM